MWLQQWVGYTATWAGMAMAPVGVLAILLTPLGWGLASLGSYNGLFGVELLYGVAPEGQRAASFAASPLLVLK